MDDDSTVGARIRVLRRWRNKMPQQTLADLAGISQSYLSKIERGVAALDRRSTIAALANALKVSEKDIVGGPHLSDDPVQSGPHASIPPLRHALTTAELGESAVDRARPVTELAAELDGPIERAWRRNDYMEEGRLLPGLLDELHFHVAAPADEATLALALQTLVEAAGHAAGLARILGYPDLGHIGAALAAQAAVHLDDPVARGKAMYHFARSDGGAWDRAARRSEAEVARLMPYANDPLGMQVLGMLMLNASMANAASLNGDAARSWLDEAAKVAKHVEDDIDRNWESFSPTNVRVWRAKIGVELGEAGGKVLELSRDADGHDLDVARLDSYPARKANFLTETGRGLAREKKTRGDAVRWLLRAEKVGPQRFRNNSRVNEAVAVMVQQEKAAAVGVELRGMAARMGIPH